MVKLHKAGQFEAAARAFGLWNKARDGRGGPLVPSRGLTARRAREAAIYLTPDEDVHPDLPQAVQAESTLAASPIAQSGGVTAVAGGALGVAKLAEDTGPVVQIVDQAKNVAETLGVQPVMLLAGAMLAAGVVVLYQRYKQRAGGWA